MPDFFEFIMDFMKKFSSNMTIDNLTTLMQSLIFRIQTDSTPPKNTLDMSKKGKIKQKVSKVPKIRIAKCWSLIRFFAEGASVE